MDFGANYKVEDMPGVAWTVLDYEQIEVIDDFGDISYDINPDVVIAVMVGDDRKHEILVEDLTEIDEDEFCHGCGQIGCGH